MPKVRDHSEFPISLLSISAERKSTSGGECWSCWRVSRKTPSGISGWDPLSYRQDRPAWRSLSRQMRSFLGLLGDLRKGMANPAPWGFQ